MDKIFKKNKKGTSKSGASSGGLLTTDHMEQPQKQPTPSPPPPPPKQGSVLKGLLNEGKTGAQPSSSLQPTANMVATKSTDVPLEETYTAISVCKRNHVLLTCNWSFADPFNRRRRWRLKVIDSRNDQRYFANGAQEHKYCACGTKSELLRELARRMHRELERENDRLYEMKSWDVRRQERENGTGRTEMPSRARLEHELGSLDVHGMGDTGISFGADGETAKESHGKEETMKRMRKEAEIARLSKMMQEKNERKAADQARIERMILARAEAQRQANGASTSVDIPIAARPEDESPKSEKTTGNTPKEVQNTIEREKSNASVLSKEDQKMLKKIKIDGRKEGIRVAEAEQDEKDRLAAKEQSARAIAQENEELEAELFGGLIENSGAPELPKDKLPKEVPKKTKSSKTVRHVPKEPVRRVIEHPSDESDSSDSTKKVKPKLKTPVKIRRKMSLADLLAARKARRESQSETEKPELPDKPSTASKEVGKKPTTESKAEDGKLSKSDEFVAENVLKHDIKDEVKLPSDALNTEKVSVEITKTDTIVVSGDQSGNVEEATVETTTLAVEVQQQDTSVERTEVTETTTVSTSSQGEMTVERSTHVEAIIATSLPEQELPGTSSASPPHEPQDGASSTVEVYSSRSHPTSPAKRKRSFTATEPQLNLETPSNQETELPSPKKRKLTSPASPTEHPAAAPTSIPSVSEPTVPPPEPSASAPETQNNPPASPGAASVASSTSSSPSKKRKMSEDRDEMVSPEETKRVKHVHDGKVPAGGEVVGESVESGESSDDSFDSLFDE